MKGCVTVSIGFLLLAALTSPPAGHDGESGTGAMWVAPELVGARAAEIQPCTQTAALRGRKLVFETVEPGDPVVDEATLTSASREVVSFEWNPATGELSYDTSATTGVFSDLVVSSPASVPGRRCGSR